MKILFIETGAPEEKYLQEAFAGNSVSLVLYGGNDYTAAINSGHPDMMFSVGFIPGACDACIAGTDEKILYISWILHFPDWKIFCRQVMDSRILLFVADRSVYDILRGYGIRNTGFLAPAYPCFPDMTDRKNMEGRSIGHFDLYEKAHEALDAHTAGFLEGIMRAQACVPEKDLFYSCITGQVLERLKKICSMPFMDGTGDPRYFYAEYLLRNHMIMKEREIISSVKKHDCTDGNSCAYTVCALERTAAVAAEAAAHGRLIISDGSGMYGTGFEEGTDYFVYHDMGELTRIVSDLKADSTKYAAAAENARIKVRKMCTYHGRVRYILEHVAMLRGTCL